MFTEKEIAYLQSQPLARIATVSTDAQPDVAPVSYQFDGRHFLVAGFDISRTFKYKNVKAGSVKVALVVDDLVSVQPWAARGLKVHGTAKIVEVKDRQVLVITPERHWSWGIEAEAFIDGKPVSRKVKHQPDEPTQ
jgi:pyridoxamine 5'-phosphate oxidase family protein